MDNIYMINEEQRQKIMDLLDEGFDHESGWGIEHNNVCDLLCELVGLKPVDSNLFYKQMRRIT